MGEFVNRYIFTIPGKCQPKERPRVMKTGYTFTPKKTVDAEAKIKLFAQNAGCTPLEGAIEIEITFAFPIPKSYSKKKRAQIVSGELLATKRPDIDNLVKTVTDALNGVAYGDDAQIISVTANKCYDEDEQTTVVINEWSL